MQTKLTLRMDDSLVIRAKSWARIRGVSLSQVVASMLEQLPARHGEDKLSPWTARLVGVGRRRKRQPLTDAAVREAHANHVAERHR
jgi:hypothetical protein